MGKWCGAMLRERRWRCVEEERGVRGGARAWRSAGRRVLVCVSLRATMRALKIGIEVELCRSVTMRGATTRGVERLVNAEAKGGRKRRERGPPKPIACAHENAGEFSRGAITHVGTCQMKKCVNNPGRLVSEPAADRPATPYNMWGRYRPTCIQRYYI